MVIRILGGAHLVCRKIVVAYFPSVKNCAGKGGIICKPQCLKQLQTGRRAKQRFLKSSVTSALDKLMTFFTKQVLLLLFQTFPSSLNNRSGMNLSASSVVIQICNSRLWNAVCALILMLEIWQLMDCAALQTCSLHLSFCKQVNIWLRKSLIWALIDSILSFS